MYRARLATAALFLLFTMSAAAQNRVAVMAASSPAPWIEDVRAKLEATGMFDEVDSYDIYTQMSPTLAQMQGYCAILVFTDYSILDGVTFGNNLADYVDGGGGVVAATFSTASVPIAGRFATDNYYALQPNTHTSGTTQTLGTIHNSCHPVLHEVTTFSGGTSSYRQTTDSLHPQAVRIADWSDGRALVVERSINGTLRIDLGFFPVSNDMRSDFWVSSTDGTKILANALQYVSSCATPSADLAITNTDDADPVAPGGNVTYTLDVDNLGPYTAETITMTDVLPAGVSYVSATGENSSCTFSAGTVACTLASLAACADEVVTIVVNVPPGTPNGTVLSHTASVTLATADPQTENNSESESTTVLAASSDLSVTKSGPGSFSANETLSYSIQITNDGPSNAGTVQLTDVLPAGTTFVSLSAPPEFSCTTPAVGATGTVTCTNPSMVPGAAPFVLQVAVGNPPPATISNTASVTTTTTDPDDEDWTASTTAGAGLPDLVLTKTAAPEPVAAGENLTYTIDVDNNGTDPATSVVITDVLPAGTTYVSATGENASCSFGSGTVTCTLASLPVGADEIITLVVHVNGNLAGGTILTNTATATSTPGDANPSDNQDSATSTVTAGADLSITKTGPSSVAPNGSIPYTIAITNDGPSHATAVQLTDLLPPGTTFVSLTAPAGFTCTTPAVGSPGTVTCTNASMAPGTATFLLQVAVGNSPGGTQISNTASVSSTADPDGTDTSASAVATVAAATAPIPSLSEWGLLTLVASLLAFGALRLKG